MSCMIEFVESGVTFEFGLNKSKQRIWVEVLLKYGNLDLKNLSVLLDVTTNDLLAVLSNSLYFSDEQEDVLMQLFLLLMGE